MVIIVRIYTSKDINVISRVQAVALNTALPIVLAILKHSHNSSVPLTLKQIITKVKEDNDLNRANYEISDESLIKNTTNELISKRLLEEKEGKITITQTGNDAVELMLLHLKTDDENDD